LYSDRFYYLPFRAVVFILLEVYLVVFIGWEVFILMSLIFFFPVLRMLHIAEFERHDDKTLFKLSVGITTIMLWVFAEIGAGIVLLCLGVSFIVKGIQILLSNRP